MGEAKDRKQSGSVTTGSPSALSIYNRDRLQASPLCGCFYCLRVFTPKEIAKWVDSKRDEDGFEGEGQTAVCPHCGIDSVVAFEADTEENRRALQIWNKGSFGGMPQGKQTGK